MLWGDARKKHLFKICLHPCHYQTPETGRWGVGAGRESKYCLAPRGRVVPGFTALCAKRAINSFLPPVKAFHIRSHQNENVLKFDNGDGFTAL